jgi:hypothetical protein
MFDFSERQPDAIGKIRRVRQLPGTYVGFIRVNSRSIRFFSRCCFKWQHLPDFFSDPAFEYTSLADLSQSQYPFHAVFI